MCLIYPDIMFLSIVSLIITSSVTLSFTSSIPPSEAGEINSLCSLCTENSINNLGTCVRTPLPCLSIIRVSRTIGDSQTLLLRRTQYTTFCMKVSSTLFLQKNRCLADHFTDLLVVTDRRCSCFSSTQYLVCFDVIRLHPRIPCIPSNSYLFAFFTGDETIETRFVVAFFCDLLFVCDSCHFILQLQSFYFSGLGDE